MKCDRCGREAENPHLMFTKFSDIGIDDNQFAININEEPPSAQCLCDECREQEHFVCEGCYRNRPLKASDVIKAAERIKCATPPEFTYYFHGAREQRETGLSVKDVVEYFSKDLSVIVVDPISNDMYRGGKPLIPKRIKTKGQKTIYLKGVDKK